MTFKRAVLDTNALVSRLLAPSSIPAQAVRRAAAIGQMLASDATLDELADVLGRAKFDPYITIRDRQEFLRLFGRISERVQIIRAVRACRDPKDDKFLELAVNGGGDCIITGDRDLLALNPFRDIPILTPAQYINH